MTIFYFQSQHVSSSDLGNLGTGWFFGQIGPRKKCRAQSSSNNRNYFGSMLARECVRYNLKSEPHISWSLKYWIQCKGSRQKPFAALFRAFLHQPPPQRRGNHQIIGQFWYMCKYLLMENGKWLLFNSLKVAVAKQNEKIVFKSMNITYTIEKCHIFAWAIKAQ